VERRRAGTEEDQQETKVEVVTEAMEHALSRLPAKAGHKPTVAGYLRLSLRVLYRGIKHLAVSDETRERAVNLLLKRHPTWSKQGRSLVYTQVVERPQSESAA
jgi:hypothetical protein